jgi:hypothetical protein
VSYYFRDFWNVPGWALWSHAGDREVWYNPLQRPFASSRLRVRGNREYQRLTRRREGREERREISKFKVTTSNSGPLHLIFPCDFCVTQKCAKGELYRPATELRVLRARSCHNAHAPPGPPGMENPCKPAFPGRWALYPAGKPQVLISNPSYI